MTDELSPCGLIRVEWQLSTGRMSHEINSPRFIDARRGTPFLTLWDEQWDANVRWQGEGRFHLTLRNYDRPGNLEAEVDLPSRSFRLVVPAAEPQPLEEIENAVRQGFKQLEEEARRRVPQSSPAPARMSGWVIAFIVLMAILIGFAFYRFG